MWISITKVDVYVFKYKAKTYGANVVNFHIIETLIRTVPLTTHF
jgi:hypothetical protein